MSIHDYPDGTTELVDENYAELRLEDGSPEFEGISEQSRKFEKASQLAALDPALWRVK